MYDLVSVEMLDLRTRNALQRLNAQAPSLGAAAILYRCYVDK